MQRIVSCVILRDHNNNALELNAAFYPLFYGDRRFHYTNRAFLSKLDETKITQDMTKIVKCINKYIETASK